MNIDRKQLIPIVALGGLGLVVLYGIFSYVGAEFRTRNERIEKLEGEVKTKKQAANKIRKAENLIRNHVIRSLPPEPTVALTAYQGWLTKVLDESGFGPREVKATSSPESNGFLTRHKVTLLAEEEMPKILAFLDRFHQNDTVHRISSLTFKPRPDNRNVSLGVEIEALSLRGADASEQLNVLPSDRYLADKFPQVSETILNRNLFQFANRPPTIDVSPVVNIFRGKAADVKWNARDPDPLDKLTWELVDAGNTAAKLDSKTGAFNWVPDTNGEYTLVVKATDNNYPPLSTEKKFKIVVTDQPTPAPPPQPKPYNIAKHAVLTAILNQGEQSEIWILVRTTGEMLKLHEGDSFEVGVSKGTVEKISERDCTLNIDGEVRRIELSGALADGKP